MASRDTTTGLEFEKRVTVNRNGINLSQDKLYQHLKTQNIDYTTILSRKLKPDEAYLEGDHLYIYEKKFQKTEGSADEKPQTCAFKIWEFRKIGAALGIKPENVTYTYIFNDWFKQDKYTDMRNFIKSIDGCDYIFEDEIGGENNV